MSTFGTIYFKDKIRYSVQISDILIPEEDHNISLTHYGFVGFFSILVPSLFTDI